MDSSLNGKLFWLCLKEKILLGPENFLKNLKLHVDFPPFYSVHRGQAPSPYRKE